MKTKSKMFLLSVATACGLGFAAIAQEASQDLNPSATQSESRQQSGESSSSAATAAQPSTSASSEKMQDGLVKHEGKVKFIKNGQVQQVTNEMKLSEGITVQPNGEVELKDGTKMTLQEGQMVTLDSQVTTIPPEALKTLKDSSPNGLEGGARDDQSNSGAGGSSGVSGSGGGSTTTPGGLR